MRLAGTSRGDEKKAGFEGRRIAAKQSERLVSARLALAMLVSAVLVAATASDMVVAVLPLMAGEFGASEALLGWVVTGYLLVLSVGIPFYGRVSDFFGLRRVFSLALAVFAAGSLVCALAPNLFVVVSGRIVQGAGAAAIPVLSMVAVTRVMPHGKRGTGMGLVASGGGVGLAAGPALGGMIGQFFGWSGLFWITTVAALVLCPLALYALPEEASAHSSGSQRRLDIAGGILLGLAAGLFLFGITRGQVDGFASFSSWGSLLAAALAAVLFVWRTFGAAHPFVPPSLFGNRQYVAAATVAFLSMFANVCVLVCVPLLVVAANGLSTGAAGLVLMPGGVAVAVLSPVAGLLSDRVGVRWPVMAGLAVMGLSTLSVSTLAAGASPLLVSAGILGVGVGFAFVITTVTNAAAGALAGEQVGVGLGIFQGAQFLGAGTSPALIGALLAARREAEADSINPLYVLDAAPFSDAFLAITAAVALACIAALGLRGGQQKSAKG